MAPKLNKIIQLRLAEADLAEAQRIAAQNKMTLSDYMRTLLFERPIKTVQSTLDLYELKRQGALLKLALKEKRLEHLEQDIKRHLQLFQEALEIWIKDNQ